MNRIIKKITSLVAALTVVLTSALVFNMPVSSTAAAEGTHSHKACGGLAHEGCNHNDIVYEEFPTDFKEVTISSDKNYYLTRDLSNDDITRIYNLENIKLNLCLNGHKIVTEKATFHPVNGAVLNICDCKGGGSIENTLRLQGVVQISEGAEANIYGGSYIGQMGSICIADSNDVVNIYGGNFISDEPVCMYNGTLSIYGGEFTSKKTCVTVQEGNISVYDGKFICTAETDDYKYIIDAWYGVTVNVFGGEMTCEKTMGVRLFDNDCVLNMSGGSISSCGAAVLTNGNNTPKVNISGGSLCSNSNATTISGGTLKMTGGTVSGFMGIGTNGEITGGTIKDCGYCGISVQQNCNVTIGGNVKFENNICDIYLVTDDDIFTVKDDFQNTASVRAADDISEDTPRRITTDGTDENALSKITSWKDKYAVKYDDSSGYLYLNYHVHEYDGDFKYDENEHWQLCKKCGEAGVKSSHSWDNGNVTKLPTEDEAGEMKYTCTECKADKTEEIDKTQHEHKFSADWASDEGLHWHEAVCGHDVRSGEEEHQFGEPTITPSTCAVRGSAVYECTVCGYQRTEELELAEHSFGEEWQRDGDRHWKICAVCGAENGRKAHEWDGGETITPPTADSEGTKKYTCTVCGGTREEKIPVLGHEHSWDSGEITTQPSCTDDGIKTYRCTCGETKTEPVAALGHSFSEYWRSNETEHWHICTRCETEKSGAAPHVWDGGTIIKIPTVSQKGEKRFECTVCGAFRTETLPATGGGNSRPNVPSKPSRPSEPAEPDKGNIIKDVQSGGNAPEAAIPTPREELISSVLSPAERDSVDSGIDIIIILTVDDATYSVPAEDRAAIEAKLGEMTDYKLGQYLDVNLLKIIGDSREKITETNALISVMLEIPEALRGKDEYSVIRFHNGETAVLHDIDDNPDTVTVKTDKFSTYALAYREKAIEEETGEVGSDENKPAPNAGETSEASAETSSPVSEDLSEVTDEPSRDTTEASSEASGVASDGTQQAPSEDPRQNGVNPPTGAAASLIPLAAILSGFIAMVYRKKK